MTQTYTNAQKLAAVLNSWAAPLVNHLVSSNLSKFPAIAAIENRVRNSGWVSPRWSLTGELAPLIQNVSAVTIEPMLAQYLQGIPDESIPSVAHGVVDNALQQPEGVSLFEGRVNFDHEDLQRLKRLLNINLPIGRRSGYEVLQNEPIKTKTND